MAQTIGSGTGNSTGTGKIVTFYSFKGGVGRTMAVANLAFLAALNGKRVLVMDWDLEAPGLAYYFRGMRDAVDNLAFDAAPGVLDILCQWGIELGKAESEEGIDLLQQRMEEGLPFQDCVRPLVQATLGESLFPAIGCLDIIGPGARTIASLNNMPYEEALAQFSWQGFFEQQAGGFVLEKMRLWAKQHYDFIFIDSRTGLADIAGICTMQLPDIVALCFALNQQNIDGIARVAAAIHKQRKNDVILRAVPMRVAQRDSAQESEAQARAASALTRTGGFDKLALKIDMEELSIPLVDHLPFYETLAPFVAKDPAFDQLTLSYLRLGKKLFDPSLAIPDFNQAVIAEIKQRLQPRNATVEYLDILRRAEPERAYGELQHLAESAVATLMHGGTLEQAYILALLDVGLYIVELTEEPERDIALVYKILSIARILNNREPEIWQNTMRFAIERVLEYSFPLSQLNNIKLFQELDAILELTPSTAINLKRLGNLHKASNLCFEIKNDDELFRIIEKITLIISDLEKNVTRLLPEEQNALMLLMIDTKLLSGKWQIMVKQEDAARREFEAGLALLNNIEAIDVESKLGRLRFEFHYQLAILPKMPAIAAAKYAIAAVKCGRIRLLLHYFPRLAQVVQCLPSQPETVFEFCEAFLISQKERPGSIVQYFVMQPRAAIKFLKINISFINVLIIQKSERAEKIMNELLQIVSSVLATELRYMGKRSPNEKLRSGFEIVVNELITILEEAQFPIADFPALLEARTTFESAQSSFNLPLDNE